MSLAVCVFIAWCVILIFAIIPKKLSAREMTFLFFANTIFELSIFTVFHLNMHWLDVSRSVEKSLADLVMRLIFIPVGLMIAANVLLYSRKFLKWSIIVGMALSGIPVQMLMKWLGILTTPHWNMMYTVLMYSTYIAFSRLMTSFIVRLDRQEGPVV